jgi:hypothetical protein
VFARRVFLADAFPETGSVVACSPSGGRSMSDLESALQRFRTLIPAEPPGAIRSCRVRMVCDPPVRPEPRTARDRDRAGPAERAA